MLYLKLITPAYRSERITRLKFIEKNMDNFFETTYILSQLFSLAAFIMMQIAYHLSTKKAIFALSCAASILDMCHYGFLGAWAGNVTKILALCRNLFLVGKEDIKFLDKKIFMYVFAVAYVIVAIMLYDGIASLLPFTAAFMYLFVTWNGKELAVKRIAFICYWLWLIYNILILSIVGSITTVIALISTGIAYYREHKKKERENMLKHTDKTSSYEEIINFVSDKLGISQSEVEKNCKVLEEIDGYYFWNPARGGSSLMISKQGQYLQAASSIDLTTMLAQFVQEKESAVLTTE